MGSSNDTGAPTSRRSGAGMGSAGVSLKQKTLMTRPFSLHPGSLVKLQSGGFDFRQFIERP